MDKIILFFGKIVDKVGNLINLNSTAGSIAVGIGIIAIAIVLCSLVWKIAKKTVGKFVAVILIIAIILGSGLLTLGQVKNYLEASGAIVTEGWANASENGGSAFIYWLQSLMDDEDSDVGGFEFNGTW